MASTQELLLGEGAGGAAPNYIEDVFSTYLYTGTGVTNPIVNNIDLSTKGGLVWLKSRSTPSGSSDNNLYDTVRGASQLLVSNTTDAATTATRLSFQATGFNLTNAASSTNESGITYASWTFRKQPKFFDIVTWTGNGANPRTITHSLGSAPGCIIFKNTTSAGDWYVYHRSLATSYELKLNTTDAQINNTTGKPWNTTPTSTEFYVGGSFGQNVTGETYVAYLFAHNAGGFGLTGTDNVISCGSFTAAGGVGSVNLGYEPQWLLFKQSNGIDDWLEFDNMRGMTTQPTYAALLRPNSSAAEATGSASGAYITPTATGFDFNYGSGGTYIYIAIRRGPMKVPTDGTKVFKPDSRTGTGSSTYVATSGFPTDTIFVKKTGGSGSSAPGFFWERLGPVGQAMTPTSTAAESTLYQILGFDAANNDGVRVGNTSNYWDAAGGPYLNFSFKRAPSFHDVVMYTGTGSATTVTHNLGVAPELMIVKVRSTTGNWPAWSAALALGSNMYLNTTGGISAGNYDVLNGNNTTGVAPTSTTFAVGNHALVNGSGSTYVAYLFATCTGVSKVGSFSGTGATQTINCGFTSGARFVLIKRTDTTGDWYVWNTSSGMVAGTDPYTLFNTNAASVNANNVYTTAVGFQIVGTGAGINASGGTYIYLAIA